MEITVSRNRNEDPLKLRVSDITKGEHGNIRIKTSAHGGVVMEDKSSLQLYESSNIATIRSIEKKIKQLLGNIDIIKSNIKLVKSQTKGKLV